MADNLKVLFLEFTKNFYIGKCASLVFAKEKTVQEILSRIIFQEKRKNPKIKAQTYHPSNKNA